MKTPQLRRIILTAAIAVGSALSLTTPTHAADHRDAPTAAYDAGTDIADVFFFKDPTPLSTNVVIIGTSHGFIVPGEAVNEAIFDPVVRYRFEIYNKHVNVARPPNPGMADTAAQMKTKKAAIAKYVASIKPDKFIDVTFTPRKASPGPAGPKAALEVQDPQDAKVQFTGFDGISPKAVFTVPVLNPSLSAMAPDQAAAVKDLGTATVTPATAVSPKAAGIKVFCGESDDPFFFDIPAFGAFINSVRGGAADPTVFNRARDTFAGYNVLTIAISLPITELENVKVGAAFTSPGPIVGLDFLTQRHTVQIPGVTGDVRGVGAFKTVDRMGNPAVNVALIPFNRKNSYNVGTPKDDANLKFALPTPITRTNKVSEPGILDELAALGTTGTPFDPATNVGTLAAVAVLQGDLLKLDTSKAATVGFPNGRRLQDDTIDILLGIITNGVVATGDKVNANDVPLGMAFPFVAPSNQPLANGAIDNTQN